MKKESVNPNRVIFIVVVFFVVFVFGGDIIKGKLESATPNHEVLRSAQPKDLLLCVVERSGVRPVPKRAVLVEHNSGTELIGREVSKNMVAFPAVYPYDALDGCKIKVVRPGETEIAAETMTRIILYGFDSNKLAQVN